MAGQDTAIPPDRPAAQPPAGQTQTPGILPGHHWENLPQDDDDADSALGSDVDSSTASVSSSIFAYRTIQGRTFHSERDNAQYWASNDDRQNESLDILHHVHTLTMGGKLFLAPIKNIQKAVDIGTGTGIWAIDFADEFPNTEVIGTDVSPIQPAWVPPNLKFEIEDCLSEWTFAPNSLDYVHIRWLIGSVPDWFALFREAYRCLRPGGYVESMEPDCVILSDDNTVAETSAQGQWGKLYIEGGLKFGRPFTILDDDLQRRGMQAAGFVDIQEQMFKTPQGAWPADPKMKEIGRYQQLVVEQDTEGWMVFLASALGWTTQQVTVFAAQYRREIRDNSSHAYYRQKAVWARKPGGEQV